MSAGRLAVGTLLAAVVAAGLWYAAGPSTRDSNRKTAPRTFPVITVPATAQDFKIRRRTIGIVESPAIVVVRSRIDSVVLEQHVADGQLVRKGDLLFTLDDREIQALIARDEAQLAKDMAGLAQAKAELDRKLQLVEKKIAPQQQLDEATAAYKAAQQTVEADQAVLQADRLKLGYAKLVAPITGRVGAVRTTPGNLVSASDTAGLITVTQIRPIRIAFTLAERDLSALRRAFAAKPPAKVRVYSPGSSEPIQTGVLDFVDSSVDVASGTIAAKGRFENQKFELWPGMFVDIEIDLSVRPDTVMVPQVAILSGQKGPFVFIARDDQTAEMRSIELAGTEREMAALAKGVAAGERVIVEGQMRLTTGARITETPPSPAPGEAVKAGAPKDAAGGMAK